MSDFNKIEKDNINVLSPFKLLVLQNFPFIEADFDAITNYQLMCKMAEYMNNINSNVNTLNENENRVYNAFNELVDYINNYFDNLDVQEEINNKLDDMASDGTLTDIIRNYIDPLIAQTNIKVETLENDVNSLKNSYGTPLTANSESQITDTNKIYVYTGVTSSNFTNGNWYYYNGSAWVSGGVYQSSSVNTDKTLELENVPADAMYTGLIKNALTTPAKTILDLVERGWFNPETMSYITNTNYICTKEKISFDDFVSIEAPLGYRIGAYFFKDGEEVTPVTISFRKGNILLLPNYKYIIQFRRESTAERMEVSEVKNYKFFYGGVLENTHLFQQNSLSQYTVDLNKFKYDSTVWLQPGNNVEFINLPHNSNAILTNYSQYNLGANGDVNNTYMKQVLYYTSLRETWTRVLRVDREQEYSPWVKVAPEFESIFKGKKLSIYGDSISTYAGYIPEGNDTYYTGSNAGVNNVNQTWWMKVINALGFELLVNNSWSGRPVSNQWDGPAGYKLSNVEQLRSGTTNPDVIIVKLGINDFDRDVLLGNYDGTTALPTDPSTFSNAYAIMLDNIMKTFPLAKVYCCTLMQVKRSNFTHNPEINGNGETLIQFNERIVKLAHSFGAEVIDHGSCGITQYNINSYMGDYNETAGTGTHPNANGMSLIANKTIHDMDNEIRKRY